MKFGRVIPCQNFHQENNKLFDELITETSLLCRLVFLALENPNFFIFFSRFG